MTESVMNVRPRTDRAARKTGIRVWLFVVAAIVLTAAATLGFDYYSGKLGIVSPNFEVVQTSAGKIIKVPPGGNVQAAIARAESGDIVELQAGATYYGEIKLPKKALTDYVTIRSSAAADLPADKRVGPDQAASMAKILTRDGNPALSAANGAHHYRFVGIEFAPSSNAYVYNLVLFGNGEAAADLPHDLEIDRSYLHTLKSGVARRGIALNSAHTTIKNSYIEGFGFPGEETQGICGWSGTRNASIINNYIEGGAENIMFGGSDPDSEDLTPTDIEIRGNHLNKPAEWNPKATLKTLFELKNAKRVRFIGNYIENNWKGSAFRITVRNQDGGAAFSTIEDVIIRDNIIKNSGDGINILGKDDTHPSRTLKNLTIENNLFINIAGGNGFDGSGYLIQVADGENITIANNTAFNTGNIVTFYGDVPKNFVFRDNITGHGNYGIHGPVDLRSPAVKAMFQNNLFINLNRVGSGDYAFPDGNKIVSGIADVGFANTSSGDYRLSQNSRYKGKGQGGRDLGSDLPPRNK